MGDFTLTEDGDREERAAWPMFLRNEFPQYEHFWRVFVVPLTGRVLDSPHVNFLSTTEIEALGRAEWHVEAAQLHYTTLLHLVRVCHLRSRSVHDRDSFMEAIVRLDAATDTARELLGRCLLDQGVSASWDETAGRRIRGNWTKEDEEGCRPFKALADYRNALLHGRMRPEYRITFETGHGSTTVPFYPLFEAVPKESTLDWRKADLADFAPADHLVDQAWHLVLDYLRTSWSSRLLPWAASEGMSEPVRSHLRQVGLASGDGLASTPSCSPEPCHEYFGGSAIAGGSTTSSGTTFTWKSGPQGD